jgi:hypothetical protein
LQLTKSIQYCTIVVIIISHATRWEKINKKNEADGGGGGDDDNNNIIMLINNDAINTRIIGISLWSSRS